jgi:hypothetical protein
METTTLHRVPRKFFVWSSNTNDVVEDNRGCLTYAERKWSRPWLIRKESNMTVLPFHCFARSASCVLFRLQVLDGLFVTGVLDRWSWSMTSSSRVRDYFCSRRTDALFIIHSISSDPPSFYMVICGILLNVISHLLTQHITVFPRSCFHHIQSRKFRPRHRHDY